MQATHVVTQSQEAVKTLEYGPQSDRSARLQVVGSDAQSLTHTPAYTIEEMRSACSKTVKYATYLLLFPIALYTLRNSFDISCSSHHCFFINFVSRRLQW